MKGGQNMDLLKKLFPISFKSTEKNPFIIALIVYIVVGFIAGLVIGLLSKIPIIGFVFGIVGAIFGLYTTVGLVLSILVFLKVIK